MMRFLRCVAVLSIVLVPTIVLAQDKFFDSNGVRIRYVDQGSGTPVVLIHGFGGNIERSWVETGVLPNLAKDHRVIALDCRGHGKSEKPHDPKAYGAEMGQDAVRLLDYLGIPRAHIVGYSMGGVITAKLLTMNPDRFLTATLGGSSGRRTWTARDDESAEVEAAEFEHGIAFRSVMLRTAPNDKPRMTEEEILKGSRERVARNDTLALAALVRSRRDQTVTNDQMSAVRVPTIGIVGSADAALTGMNELKKAMPSLEVRVIDGASHTGERGAPRRPEFVNAIRQFIASHTQISAR